MNDHSLFLKLDPEVKQPEPYLASIEPLSGDTFLHNYHLGTHILIAMAFCEELHRRHGAQTIGLMRAGKLIDVYDGREWSSNLNERLFEEELLAIAEEWRDR